jgi:hypothetical protein
MGNAAAPAVINVVVDNSQFVPGTAVHGKVYLMINSDKVEAESLILQLVGLEHTVVKYTTGSGKHRRHHTKHANAIFLNLSYPLTQARGGYFEKGQYEFPFLFTLPSGILPTMRAYLPGSHGGSCYVSYFVEAKLHRPGWFKWDVHHKQELLILGPPISPTANFITYRPPVEYPLTFCCCFNRGSVRLGIYAAQSLLAAGESFDVNYVIQNNSTSRIKAMEIFVVEEVHWSAAGRNRCEVVNLFYKRIDDSEIQLDLSPIDPSNQNNNNTTIGEITNQQVLHQLKEILDSRRYRYPATISPNARASMKGSLILVKHYLKIRIATPFGTSDPEIYCDILVHRHPAQASPATGFPQIPPQQQQQMALPPNWHAVVAPQAQLPTPSYLGQPQFSEMEEAAAVVMDPNQQQIQQQQAVAIPYGVGGGGGGGATPPIVILLQSLSNTYNQPAEFTRWCQSYNVDLLTPQDIGALFQSLRSIFDQISVAEQYATAARQISCAHISAAAQAANSSAKLDIIRKLATKCDDKGNKEMVKNILTPFEWMCVENFFN